MGLCPIKPECVSRHIEDSHWTNQVSIQVSIFYDDKLAALPVENVKVNNASIEDALNVILKGKDISYKVEDNIVYLSEKSAAPQEGNQQGKERTITGVVSDDMGPLIGVNVLIKGTSNGCITDLDGNFTLTTTGSESGDRILLYRLYYAGNSRER